MEFGKQILVICLCSLIVIGLTVYAFFSTERRAENVLFSPSPVSSSVFSPNSTPDSLQPLQEEENWLSGSPVAGGNIESTESAGSMDMENAFTVAPTFTPQLSLVVEKTTDPGASAVSALRVVSTPAPGLINARNWGVFSSTTPEPANQKVKSQLSRAPATPGKTPQPGGSSPSVTPAVTPTVTLTPTPLSSPSPSPSPSPSSTPEDIFIMDYSHRGGGGATFGILFDEVKRWQTFTANAYSHLLKVEVNICKSELKNQSDVTVELYATYNDLPAGGALAWSSIPAKSISKDFTVVSAPLRYDGLMPGAKYAVVLGQQSPQTDHYKWRLANVGYHQKFGKVNGMSNWTEESNLGTGWLQVYVAKNPPGYSPLNQTETAIIDISHEGSAGFAFGVGLDEVKRWQIFTANSFPNLVRVEVKIYKYAETGQNDLLVELYAAGSNAPFGLPLAQATIPAQMVGLSATVVGASLKYKGLVAGRNYAVALSQVNPKEPHYNWCMEEVNGDLKFGKFNWDAWIDESHLGDGWLEVYVTK